MKIDAFFVVPINLYSNNSFLLMPDDGDTLPIDRLVIAPIIGACYIDSLKSDCYICKVRLPIDLVLDLKMQTSNFMTIEQFEYIKSISKDMSDLIMMFAAQNMDLYDVEMLKINKMYAGRSHAALYEKYPEVIGKVGDCDIAETGF